MKTIGITLLGMLFVTLLGTGRAAACASNAECSDTAPCTDDLCIGGTCTHPPKRLGEPCTDDGKQCTYDFCDGTTSPSACTHPAKAGGTPCGDDGKECTFDLCDGTTSATACTHPPKAGGTPCGDDGKECTVDLCDGTTSTTACSHAPKSGGTPCSDDGKDCTLDLCDGTTSATACTHPPKVGGTPCADDGNQCTADFCDGTTSATACGHPPKANGAPCNDGTLCTPTDICLSGVCTGSLVPALDCRTAGVASLTLKNNSDDTKDSVQFKWTKGQSTSLAEFGDPTATAGYALCVYDHGFLAMTADVPAAAQCDGKPCWKAALHQYKFKAKTPVYDGLRAMTLLESSVDTSKITVKTTGSALPLMPVTGPVVVQIVNNTSGPCFSATFNTVNATINTVDKFSARVSVP